MKALKTPFLIGAAAVAVIGLTGAAAAEIEHSHVMQVRLPDGTLEEIRYTGDTPPVVRLQTGWAPIVVAWPEEALDADAPFAVLDRLSAQMDREAAALLQQAHDVPGPLIEGPEGFTQVGIGKAPRGMTGYSVVSTMSGGKVCTRVVEYGRLDASAQPKAVTRVSGDCDGPAKAPPQAAGVHEAAQAPLLQQVSARF